MKAIDVIDGLMLLQRYRNEAFGDTVWCDADGVFVEPTDWPMSHDDVERMVKLGWYQITQSGTFTAEDYNDETQWCIRK